MVIDKKRRYLLITSFLLTIVVFLGGITLGWNLDDFRADKLLENIKQSELTAESFLVEESFIDHYGGDRCELLATRIYEMQALTRETGKLLAKWGEGDSLQKSDFDYLKRKHIILETRFYLLLDDFENSCDAEYDVVLFFYTKDQEDSARQGYILDNLADKYDDLIILSIDKDYQDEPLVELLMSEYDVTVAPTLIINHIVKFEGFTQKAKIESVIK